MFGEYLYISSKASYLVLSISFFINNLFQFYSRFFYGLEKYIDIGAPDRKNLRFDDTYLELDDKGNVISFINCTRDGGGEFPICKHEFMDKGLFYHVAYNKEKYLPLWQESRRKAIEFIDKFEIKQGSE